MSKLVCITREAANFIYEYELGFTELYSIADRAGTEVSPRKDMLDALDSGVFVWKNSINAAELIIIAYKALEMVSNHEYRKGAREISDVVKAAELMKLTIHAASAGIKILSEPNGKMSNGT